MKRYVCLFILACALSAAPLVCAADNATARGDQLRIREKPNTSGRILGSLDKGARVEALAHTDATDSIDGFTGYWYYVSYRGVFGYVFGKYLKIDTGTSIPSEKDYRAAPAAPPSADTDAPATLADITGDWPMYYDAPNIIFSFYPDMTARYVESTYVGGGDRVVTYPPVSGTYTFDGKSITARWDDGTTGDFMVLKFGDTTSLVYNGIALLPELHTPLPANR